MTNEEQPVQPDRIKIGASVVLISLEGFARDWGVDANGVLMVMNAFGIKRIAFPGRPKRYVSLYPVEQLFFELGLPEAFKADKAIIRTHQELAGVLYGTLTKEVIRERVKALAKTLKSGPAKPLTSRPKRPRIKRRK